MSVQSVLSNSLKFMNQYTSNKKCENLIYEVYGIIDDTQILTGMYNSYHSLRCDLCQILSSQTKIFITLKNVSDDCINIHNHLFLSEESMEAQYDYFDDMCAPPKTCCGNTYYFKLQTEKTRDSDNVVVYTVFGKGKKVLAEDYSMLNKNPEKGGTKNVFKKNFIKRRSV